MHLAKLAKIQVPKVLLVVYTCIITYTLNLPNLSWSMKFSYVDPKTCQFFGQDNYLMCHQHQHIPTCRLYLQLQCFLLFFPQFIYLSYFQRNITKRNFYSQTCTSIYKPWFIFKDKWCRFIELMNACMYIGICMYIYACMSSS